MKITTRGTLAITLTLLTSATAAFGVVDQTLQVQGTNLVLSWPSMGYEQYMIQGRPSLDPSTPWVVLTNAYPANSTNRTAYVIPCCTLTALGWPSGGGWSGGGGGGEIPPFPGGESLMSMETEAINPLLGLWAIPADGSGSAVPLAIYPPGFDTNDLLIFEPPAELLAETMAFSESESDGGTDGPLGLTSGGCDCPDMGFFRIWHIPDWAFNVTNYTYDSSWFFPADFKDYRDMVDSVQLLIDGELFPYAEFMPYDTGGQTEWGMGIDFDRLTNGTHQIQLITTLRLNDDVGESSVFLVLSNNPVSVVVNNLVTFPDWDNFMQGDTYTFKAQLANPDTDWTIDIYDVWGQYVNSGSGHTYNGQVSWTWDQYDWMGNNRDNFDSDPYFYSEITFDSGSGSAPQGNGPQAAQTTKPTPPPVKGFPDRGEWLVAYCDRWYSDAPKYTNYPDVQPKYIEAMNAVRGGPILIGDTAYSNPLKFGTNVYTQAEREQTWTNLLNGIGNLYMRNFYYHGHGGPTILGGDRHVMNTNGGWDGGVLTSRNSKSALYSWQVAAKTKYNRYRFVFLDGCSTAAGDWPNAFNVSKTNHTVSFYENHPNHPRPSVFVGWNEIVGGEPGTSVYKALDFRKNWMGIWANGSGFPTIKRSLEDANSIYEWLPVGTFNSKIRFYGYEDMKIRDYNRKGDWRWP